MRAIRRLAVLTFVPFVLLFVTSQAGETDAEVKLKTGFLFKFLHYVEWPDTATSENRVDIAVLGERKYYDALNELKSALGATETVKVSFTTPEQGLDDYDVVLIALRRKNEIEEVLGSLDGSPTLTVGDGDGLADAGVMISFISVATERGKKVRFEINSKSAKEANIKISSQLLNLAVKVIGQDGE